MPSPKISPAPVRKANELSFPDAVREILNMKKVTRIVWKDSSIYGVLQENLLMIHIRGEFHQWVLSTGDLDATDWIIIEETN